ncbi:hypothetical protein BLNAU_18353 [Blattamonas nauphoetae]|uniref:Uncharacterized protein n=1 Tax=Blattamonas nauphoetae TaxID=2049346 RepID=A0ABQ9X4H7_9EUKA|nr:hypothetical protein BLNAU_18353 [Blattamonas nauphoetae]
MSYQVEVKGAVTDSYFDKCVAVRGPAIFAEDAKLTGSNNSIIGCSSVEMGTLIFSGWRRLSTIFHQASPSFLPRQRHNRIRNERKRRVYWEHAELPLTPEKIADCDTSSDYLGLHISNPATDSASIPQVSKATHIVSSMAMESSTATLTVTCAHAMTGTMAAPRRGHPAQTHLCDIFRLDHRNRHSNSRSRWSSAEWKTYTALGSDAWMGSGDVHCVSRGEGEGCERDDD